MYVQCTRNLVLSSLLPGFYSISKLIATQCIDIPQYCELHKYLSIRPLLEQIEPDFVASISVLYICMYIICYIIYVGCHALILRIVYSVLHIFVLLPHVANKLHHI